MSRDLPAERGSYLRIAHELRQRIASGDPAAGAMLASEPALCQQYSVARGTIRAALAMLAREGLVEVIPGRGRRVAPAEGASAPVAAYERIAAELARHLRQGRFSETRLPSEARLAAEYGVSRNTVRRAYKELVDAGLVVVKQGVGAFVAPGRPPAD